MAVAERGFGRRPGSILGPRKTIEETIAATEQRGRQLRRELSRWDVLVFGIGVIVGAGIFVLTGVAAATEAGPAVTLSFVGAAVVCGLCALCYAEFAAMVPVAGSAYTFSYATLGEVVAFLIGWDLVLEFTVGASAVAVGWSGYLDSTLDQIFGVALPAAIAAPPSGGGVVNLPAVAIVLALGGLLYFGIRLTARANAAIVIITLAVLATVVIAGATHVEPGNWTPFTPFGLDGIVSGAAIVFFAFIGFDIVATTAEETRRPQRDMPFGILGSLAVTTLLYVAVALVITGMVAYTALNSEAPIADAFDRLNQPWLASIVYAGALVALTNTVLILMLGQSRVAFAMSRDRLFPRALASTDNPHSTPHRIIVVLTLLVALLAGFTGIDTLAELVNIGTLAAFVLVSIGVLWLRRAEPDRERPFRAPFFPALPVLAALGSIVLIATLEPVTWLRFGIWMALGLVVYLLYSRHRSAARGDDGEDGGDAVEEVGPVPRSPVKPASS